ncbi:MAG: flippase-like domain-containing protein [Candidatus Eisenbacteria bacterium]|uniref:Flippase-like domain-containing protein n=1 Tax=Eiseniibacteriota bacterium TaxID=2212470 RepID=A0A538U9V2_UNCEI|nr:MAG: flippase-like domain-containing protein [Candidatus Eisenbacteria bacterium]
MSRGLQFGIGIVISAFCLWLAMHDVRPAEVLGALGQANYLGFVALILLTLLGFWIRAFRWRWLLTTPEPITLDPLYSATMIGFMANNLLPLRLGEFVRAWALGRRAGLSKTTVFATVVVERVVDMITLIVIFGITMFVHPIGEGTEAGRLVRHGATVMIVGAAALTLFAIVLERQPRTAKGLVTWMTSPLPPKLGRRLAAMLDHFVDGLALFRDLPRLLWVFVLSFLMFGVFALCLTASMWSFRISAPWYAGLVMLVITAIGIMVPAAPGYIGTLHVACKVGLRLFNVGPELSVPFAWFFWAGQWIPVTVVGLAFLRREGLSLGALGRVQDEAA